VASGTVALAGAAVTWLHKEEDDPSALGRSGLKLGRLQKIPGKWITRCRRGLGRNVNWVADLILNFFQGFEFKIKCFKYFQTKFELRSN
jgi:hypothetical protein